MDKNNSYGVYTVFLPNAIVTSNNLQNAMQRSLSMFLNRSYSEPLKLVNMKTDSSTKTNGQNLVKYLDQHYLSSEDTMTIFRCVGECGDVIGYKMDGERFQKKYTVVIAFHDAPMDTIRADAETLQEGIQRVLREYCALKNIVWVSELS
jgi:hypothetical protein